MSSLADEIERFRVSALRPIAWEMQAIEEVTNFLRDMDAARRDGAQVLAAFFSSPDYQLADGAPQGEPPLSGPWPAGNGNAIGGSGYGIGPDGQFQYPVDQRLHGYPPHPQQDARAGGYPYAPPPPPLAQTQWPDILDKAHEQPVRRTR